jgi:hypothetical protein
MPLAALSDPALQSAEDYARVVAGASDAELSAAVTERRDELLAIVFGKIESRFDPAAAGDARAVLEFRVVGRPDGGVDRWQASVADGVCTTCFDGDAQPDATLTFRPVDFLKMVTGNVAGTRLFMFGRLRIEGDLLLAARMQDWFRIPKA